MVAVRQTHKELLPGLWPLPAAQGSRNIRIFPVVPSPFLELFRKHMDVALGAVVGLSQSLELMMLEVFFQPE